MRPQLTISLLASNHIHAVRRCLDSLVPILMRIPSELIVVDTSGNDQLRELACQYTDHIVPFRWCDDFSKARNAGLKEAHGEWFMFIDDDEWLDETEEIITFFSSGEYMGYKSGTYMVSMWTRMLRVWSVSPRKRDLSIRSMSISHPIKDQSNSSPYMPITMAM